MGFSRPAQVMSENDLHAGKAGVSQNFYVGDFVLSGKALDVTQTSWWKVFSLLSCLEYVVHVSLLYSRVLMMQVMYAAIFVVVVRMGFDHT